MEGAQRERLALLLLVVAAAASAASACRRVYTRYVGSNVPRSASRRALASSRNASSRKNRTPCSTDKSSACSRMPTTKRTRRIERFGELAEPDAVVLPAEAGLDHHLLAVVRPAFDERRRREQDRLAHLRFDPAQVLVVEEVARDRPRGSRSTTASGS